MYSGRGTRRKRVGSPIRAPPGHRLFAASPTLFAGCRALHRLLPPRHPPYALIHLAIQPQPAWPGRTRLFDFASPLLSFCFLRARGTPPPVKTGRQAAAHARTSRTVKEKTGRRAGRRRLPATRKRTRSALAARRNPNRRTPPRQTPAAGAPRPVVEPGRIELPTSCVQGRRSPG